MKIWNDDSTRSRIIVLGVQDERDLPAFDPGTRQGAFFAELLGHPLGSVFATANLLETRDARRAQRAAHEALPLLDGRRVILVGRHVCALLHIDSSPLMKWREWSIPLAGSSRMINVQAAAYPVPSTRSSYWCDLANEERAMMWLAGQAWKERNEEMIDG